MKSHLGNYFRRVRSDQNIKLSRLARLVGYENVKKGCPRLGTFERTGKITGDLLSRLAQLLRIDTETIAVLIDRDRQEWERWKSKPIEPYLIIRLVSAMFCHKVLPDKITVRNQAVTWASEYARQVRLEVCLAWSRKDVIYFNNEGQYRFDSKSRIPVLTISGKSFLFEVSNFE